MEEILSVGGLTAVLIEGIKIAWRKWVAKDPLYEFPTAFYTIALPLSNALMPFVLFFLGLQVESPVLTMGWQELLKYLGVIFLSSLVSLVAYTGDIKPLRDYGMRKAEEKKIEKFEEERI